ncbi:GNAT family N-acetyltransferase [Ruminococcaceae bacterium OttesenSCG-928-A16]|nr:GNAT family N-acetyltransferase [Ruminococcaceae bacterium OttesenSCG-928-A16]
MPFYHPLTFENFTVRHLPACTQIAATAPDPWRQEDVAAELSLPARAGFVAIGKTGVVGFAFFKLEDNTAVLLQIAVYPAHRRQGVAAALLNHAFATLAAQGFTGIVLEVRAGNIAALALYNTLGFAQIARRPALYTNPTEDGFTLQKIL